MGFWSEWLVVRVNCASFIKSEWENNEWNRIGDCNAITSALMFSFGLFGPITRERTWSCRVLFGLICKYILRAFLSVTNKRNTDSSVKVTYSSKVRSHHVYLYSTLCNRVLNIIYGIKHENPESVSLSVRITTCFSVIKQFLRCGAS